MKKKGILVLCTQDINKAIFINLDRFRPHRTLYKDSKIIIKKIIILLKKCAIKHEKIFWFLVLENFAKQFFINLDRFRPH